MNIYNSPKYNSNYIDSFLIWLISLCSLGFFTLLIPVPVVKATVLLGVLLVIFFLLVHMVYGTGPIIRKHFLIEVVIIIIALITSAIAAEFFHSQSILNTLFAQYEFYFFFFYFLIHLIKPDPDKLLNMFVWLGYVYAVIYFLQYLAYPVEIVSSRSLEDRGTVRILLPGSEFMFTAWFILLSRYFTNRKIIHIIGLLPFILVIVLLATRQVMAATALLTLLNIILSKKLKSKILVVFLIALSIIPFYYLFQGVFEQIVAVSEKQQTNIQEDIRFLAARYFLFDLNHNPIWIFTGNGMPAPHSDYGRFMFRLADDLGYNQSDVGIIGDMSKFGILYALAQIIYLIKLSVYRTREKYSFIRYDALMILMTMFTGAGLKASNIVLICCIFYIFDTDRLKT